MSNVQGTRNAQSTPPIGRPRKITLTRDELWALYLELGTLAKVAEKLGVTSRTVKKYLQGLPKHIGRKRGKKLQTPFKVWVANNPNVMLGKSTMETYKQYDLASLGVSYKTFLREVNNRKRHENLRLKALLRKYLTENIAVSDLKGRMIPTKAIKYVVIGKWTFGEKLRVKVVLRDGFTAKLMFFYTPTFVPLNESVDVAFDPLSPGAIDAAVKPW